MANIEKTLTDNNLDPLIDNISKAASELKQYIENVKKPDQSNIPQEIKNIYLIILHFINNPSQNEVYRAQTHVANMIDQMDDDQQTDKEILEQTQIHLDKLYELLEQQKHKDKLTEQSELLKYIDDSIQEGVRNLSLNTPQQNLKTQPSFPNISTPTLWSH